MPVVAAVQFRPEFRQVDVNIGKMVRYTKTAAAQGAKLIVHPELATTGYSFMGNEDVAPFAEVLSASSGSFAVLSKLARDLGVAIVWGLPTKDAGTGEFHNSQVYVGPTGDYVVYHKVNPFGNDYLWATPGRANPPVIRCVATGRKVGLLICRDIRDKKDDNWSSFYEPGDADIVAFSAAWGDGGFPATTWMEFVANNRVALVVSNRYGQETCNNFGEGGSCIVLPSGKVQCKGLRWSEDCIVLGEVA